MAVDQDRTARARKTASDFEARCMNVIGAKREFGVLNCTFDKTLVTTLVVHQKNFVDYSLSDGNKKASSWRKTPIRTCPAALFVA
jgi:hypothetical protein